MTTYDPKVIRRSVQTAPINENKDYAFGVGDGGGWLIDTISHAEPLPQWGLRIRDLRLRQLSYALHNTLWQGAVAALIKRIQATPWEIKGKRNVEYYQDILQYADMGQGWESFIGKVLWDFLHQDFGAVVEIVGGGDPSRPLTGKVMGLNVLDSLSCVATPVNEYPIVYWNEENGKMHRMHHERVWRWADLASPHRRSYNNGFCALSRYASEAMVDVFLGRHDYEMLSDLPPSGIMTLRGILADQWKQIKIGYEADRNASGAGIWRKTMIAIPPDPTLDVDVKLTPFSVTPEGFSQKEFTDLHVNKLALALGVDPQDIWPLSGQGLGTGTQSVILSEKGQGKMFGYILQMLTRFVNWTVLPKHLEFQFKYEDTDADKLRAEQAQIWTGVTLQAFSAGLMDEETALRMLANTVPEFNNVLMDADGQVRLPSADPKEEQAEVIASDDTQLDTEATPTDETTADNQTPNPDAVSGQGGEDVTGAANRTLSRPPNADADFRGWRNADYHIKAYTDTRAEYERNVTLIMTAAQEGSVNKASFGIRMRSALNTYGRAAYLDGLSDGGVEVESYNDLPTEEKESIAGLLAANSSYITDAANKIFGADGVFIGTPDGRAAMWGNKSLLPFYNAGIMSADKNGMYEFAGDDGDESCDTCKRLKGQRHRFQDWERKRLRPGQDTDNFECKGFRCNHKLDKTRGRARGNY